MTPNDFVRSLTYGAKQPDGLGLDSFNKLDPKVKNFHSKKKINEFLFYGIFF